MASKSAVLFALASAVAAQQSIIELPFFGYDDQSIVGSVIAVRSSVTTISLACPSGEDQNSCGLAAAQTLTVGPSTYNMYMSDEDYVMTQDCTADTVNTDAVCVESVSGSSANDPGVSTATYDLTDIAVIDVSVTAGASLLGSAAVTGPGIVSAFPTVTATAGAGASGSSSSSSGGVIVVSGTGATAVTSTRTTGVARTSTGTGSVTALGSGSSSTSHTSNGAAATALPVILAAGAGLLGVFL